MAEGKVLVVIPTYDERDNLPRVIPLVLESHPAVDILVVDDNSPDGTGLLAAGFARDNPRVHALHREGKGGLGGAYIAGFNWGLERDYGLFFEMDADLSHNPRYLPALRDGLVTDADVTIGSRYVDGVRVENWPFRRLLLSRIANAQIAASTPPAAPSMCPVMDLVELTATL